VELYFLDDAPQRYIPVLSTPPTSGLHRNLSFVQHKAQQFVNDAKPQYTVVFNGREESSAKAESLSMPTADSTAEQCNSEEIQLNLPHTQDSDDTDSSFSSSLNSQSPSLSCPEEVNQEVIPI